jgi:RNA recognition motif-containing protein
MLILIDGTESKNEDHSSARKSAVIYIGRIPYGFFESEMRSYFSQFGEVLRLRLSRNKLTGKSKHYAFIEFAHPEVADIVSETHNNMLMCDRLIKCSIVPIEKVMILTFFCAFYSWYSHALMLASRDRSITQCGSAATRYTRLHQRKSTHARYFFDVALSCSGADSINVLKCRVSFHGFTDLIPRSRLQAVNRKRTREEEEKRVERLVADERKRRRKLEAAGIEYDFPGYEALRDAGRPKRTKFADE